jgi:signal transduction histidine kinase
MRLQAKVPLLAILLIAAIGTIMAGGLLYYQRSVSVSEFRRTADALVRSIQGSLRGSMLVGNPKYVQEALVSIGSTALIDKASLVSANGAVAGSSDPSQIGSPDLEPGTSQALTSGVASTGFETQSHTRVFHVVTPVFNEPACQSCHPAQQTVLGAIDLDLDTSLLASHMRTETILIAISALLTFAIIGGGLALMLRRTVFKRLSALAATAGRLSGGDYAARSTTQPSDEIGVLAATFNEMASSVEQRDRTLQETRDQLARWNSRLEEMVRVKTRELSIMNAVLGTLSQTLDPAKVSIDAFRKTADMLEADGGAVYVLDGNPARISCIAEFSSPSVSGNDLHSAMFLAAKETIDSGEMKTTVVMPNGHRQSGSLIALPLKSARPLGALVFFSRSPDKFQMETSRLLISISEAVSIALQNAQAAQSVEEANRLRESLLQKLISAQEEERRRIARELHDEATQSLAALAMNLDDMAETLPEGRKKIKERLSALKEQVVTTFSGVRDLALELRPSALDDIGLSAAIDWCARGYLERKGLEVVVETIGEPLRLPPHTETMLFRIAQEALANIVRHAEATRVAVVLTYAPSSVVVRIEDDGKGFDVETAFVQGKLQQNLGIHGMRERANLLGGELTIRSSPGQGTVLTVRIPVANEDQQREQNKSLSG